MRVVFIGGPRDREVSDAGTVGARSRPAAFVEIVDPEGRLVGHYELFCDLWNEPVPARDGALMYRWRPFVPETQADRRPGEG